MNSKNFSPVEVDRITVWILTDNYYDSLRPDSAVAKRYRVLPGGSIHAEHGLAYFIETAANGKTGACMFDFGLDPAGVMNNMELLGVDAGSADAFALSHGHLDHWTAAVEILARTRVKIAYKTPFYVGKEAFHHRYSLRPGTGEALDLGKLDKNSLEATGVEIREIADPTEIIPGGYLTGDIARTVPYETTSSNMLVRRGDKLEPDDFRGEQALFFNIKNKGLVILSGCAHAGIVNTIRHVQKISGIDTVHAVLGGFHLIHATQERIWSTISDIQAINPEYIVPAHCTGFEAVVAFSGAMPEAFILNTAGTQYSF